MNEPFVPLNKSASEDRNNSGFRVAIVNEPANVRPFQPLGHGAGKPGARHEPRVSLQRDGARVTGIKIECSCGQTIELACAYQDTPGH